MITSGQPAHTAAVPIGRPALQRDDGAAATVAPAPASTEWAAQRGELEGIRARASARQFQAEGVVGLAAEVLESARSHMEGASTVYSQAYSDYAAVIAAGKAAAKNEEEWIDVGVGIALAISFAVGVGAAAEFLEIGSGLAIEAGKEAIVSTSAEMAKKYGAKKTGWFEVVGSTLEPGSLKPEVMKLGLWQRLVDLHSSVLKTVKMSEMQGLIASGSEFAIGEIKAQMGGGAGAEMSAADLHNLIGTLANDDGQFGNLDKTLSSAFTSLQDIKKSLGEAPSPYSRRWETERDIWILWMAELSEDEAETLDIDAIEDHLETMKLKTSSYGNGGYLGIDTGFWTTKTDCLKLIDAARVEAEKLKEKYGSIAG